MVFLQPLAKLQVVLVLCFNKLVNVNVLFNTIFLESGLEHFIVLHPLVVKFCVPLHFFYVKGVGVNFVDNLAVHCGSCALLNFGELKLEVFIHPVENHVLAH